MDEIETYARDLAPDLVNLAAGSRVAFVPNGKCPMTCAEFSRLIGYLRSGTDEVAAVPPEIELVWEPITF